jgi:hypothetical protein
MDLKACAGAVRSQRPIGGALQDWSKRGLCLCVILALTACAQVPVRADAYRQPGTSEIPQPLSRQVDGTPLPARNPAVADRWPPDLRHQVDTLLGLFANRRQPPSVSEIEKTLGVQLIEWPSTGSLDSMVVAKKYSVQGWSPTHTDFAEAMRRGDQSYFISKGDPALHRIVLPIHRPGYCLDPYELAIYTGASFRNGDSSTHTEVRHWPPAYVWGMFAWSRSGQYIGRGLSIAVGHRTQAGQADIHQNGCVLALGVFESFMTGNKE